MLCASSDVSFFTVPNLLTFARMACATGVLVFGSRGEWGIGFPLFCIAALTDMIDGSIARILGQRTRLGAFLDPVADKLLMFFSILSLTGTGFIPLGITIVIIARDVFISIGLVILKVKKVYIIFRPTYLSKLTTFLQLTTVLLALLTTQKFVPQDSSAYATLWTFVLGATTLFTTVTGFQYARIGYRMIYGTKEDQARRQ
jgi:cardiolipin synthase